MDRSDVSAEALAAIDRWLDRVPLRRVVVEWVRGHHDGVYLVGGTVRDALLGRDSFDLDFAVEGSASTLARAVADQIRGAYVLMDAERDVARVLRRTRGRTQQFDFAGLRAQQIMADLRARDLTVNAMAVPVAERWGAMLDPTGGLADLRAGVLRAASPTAFADDPVRVLRLVRLSGALGFSVDAETETLARAAAPGLEKVSAERRRDEWILILNLERSAPSVGYALEHLGLGKSLVADMSPEFDLAGGLRVLARLEELEGEWAPGFAGELTLPWGALGAALAARWREPLTAGRPRRALVRLAGLLGISRGRDAEESADRVAHAARALRLSSREVRLLQRVLCGAAGAADAVGSDPLPSPIAIYRYFRSCGEDGIEGAIVAMAAADPPSFGRTVPRALALLNAWFYEQGTLVNPPRVISGRDVVRSLGVPDGPQVGALLEQVREAQVTGAVHTREQALAFLQQKT